MSIRSLICTLIHRSFTQWITYEDNYRIKKDIFKCAPSLMDGLKDSEIYIYKVDTRQYRECRICGLREDRFVKHGKSPKGKIDYGTRKQTET